MTVNKVRSFLGTVLITIFINERLGRVLNSIDYPLNGLKMAKFCQTSSNSLLISRHYLCYCPCLTAIYLILVTTFKMRTRPKIATIFLIENGNHKKTFIK